MTAIDFMRSEVEILRERFDNLIRTRGWEMTLKHFTGMTPTEEFNDYYKAMETDDEKQNWSYTSSTITGIIQYKRLPKREERDLIATAGILVNRTAWIYFGRDITIEQGDQIIDGTEEFMVEMVIPWILSTGDSTRNIVYQEGKLQRTIDMR